ncbi:hypothetical protein DFJ58DRAFT_845007 [Suillus subalutaceus]|uniref:uncharacterized protein n=1 Tax=Suillus subalutaceus TaxID=48586 RepID=UPI001B862CDA|nr:uncharacterized protein DFJ58DRAFT_845007 [Suillus subalutaceus]KAG1841426.1 hypothetical protein DFJ58DRAFT_845007 [Suillus subalutaceus]
MYRSSPYDYWKQDSQLYQQVEASNVCRTTDHAQSTSQPHQHFPHAVLENSHGDSTPVAPQHHVACDSGSIIEDQIYVPIPTLGLPPLDQGIAHGDIQSGAAGWHPRHVSSSYSSYALSDYLPAHNTGFSDTNLADPWLISPMKEFQHDPRHQFQEEVYAHPQHVVKDGGTESHVGPRTREHMLSHHFKSPLPADSRLECLWEGCELHKYVRRDTIIRHIDEIHLGLKYRCKHWVASHAGTSFCGSRKEARLRQ